MIDWNYNLIQTINDHYNDILDPSVDLIYFIKNFEQIYRLTLADCVLLPDVFQDVMCYTFNGINARNKLILTSNEEYSQERLNEQDRLIQLENRSKAYKKGLTYYYEFIINEVIEFVGKYPQWDKLLINK